MHKQKKTLKEKLGSLGSLSPQAWAAIDLRLQLISCRPERSVPMHAGDVLFLFEGLLKEEMEVNDRVSIQQFVQPGEFFLTSQRFHHTDFVAIEPSLVGKVDHRGLYELNRTAPELAASFNEIISIAQQQLIKRIHMLILPKNERYSAFLEAYPGIAARVLDKDIMSYLDISPSYFSRSKG